MRINLVKIILITCLALIAGSTHAGAKMRAADEATKSLQHDLWPRRGDGAFYAWLDVAPFLSGRSTPRSGR